jgi:hypothetical protein
MTTELTPEQQLDAAYRERAHLVAWLAAEYPSVIAPAPDVDEPGWQIVYLAVDGAQMSWHISPRDADLFALISHVRADDPRAQWDGHTTEEKYQRIRELIGQLWSRCGRECSEGHTYNGRCELAMPSLAPDTEDARRRVAPTLNLGGDISTNLEPDAADQRGRFRPENHARAVLLQAARTIECRDVDYLSHHYCLGRQSAIDDLRELADADAVLTVRDAELAGLRARVAELEAASTQWAVRATHAETRLAEVRRFNELIANSPSPSAPQARDTLAVLDGATVDVREAGQ